MKTLVIGGNRYFGKRLVRLLLEQGHDVTLLNRGQRQDDFGARVKRIRMDRRTLAEDDPNLGQENWDVVFDQVCFDSAEAKGACAAFAGRAGRYVFVSSQSVYGAGAEISEAALNPLSHRFESAVDRVHRGQPMYFPNLDAKISFIQSEDAARALSFLASSGAEGPLNCCSVEPIALRVMLGTIESALGKKAVLAENAQLGETSPFGIESDWYMNAQKMSSFGFKPVPIAIWLEPLVQSLHAQSR